MIPRYETVAGLGRVRLYDAGPRYADRYTLLFMDEPTEPGAYVSATTYAGLAFGDNVSPNGFSQYIECRPLQTYGQGATHRRKRFASLPAYLQDHVRARATP
jgi:hypothetical protein